MIKFFHSLLILAFIAAGFADVATAHDAVKKSPSHSTRQINGTCKNIQFAQNSKCEQQTKQTPKHGQKQGPVDCETLHCNFHYIFVGQSNTLNLASTNKSQIGFTEKQPFFLQLQTAKRPPRFIS